jgi:hypothetical protein
MSDLKRWCPGCENVLSSIGTAFNDGEPCPNCGLPAEAAEAIEKAQVRGASDGLAKRTADAEIRAAKAEAEVSILRARLAEIRRALDE